MIVKIKIFVFLFLLTQFTAVAQIQNLVQKGMDHAYNLEFDSAEKIFNKIIDRYPNQPHGFYRIAQIHLWAFLGSRDQGEYQVFEKFADLAEERINNQLEKNPKDYQITFMLGNLNAFKAFANAINNSNINVFWSSKNAVESFEKTLEINPKFYDAYLGLGLYDYAMSFVPEFLKWAVNLSGLSSDKNRGLKYIRIAYRKGINEKTEASFHLSKIYTDYLAEYDSATILLKSLTSRYPKNSLFLYQYGLTLLKNRQLERAIPFFDKVIKLNHKKVPQVAALSYFRKGEINFKKNQFKTAIQNFNDFLESSREVDLTASAHFYIALSHKMLGNNEEYHNNLLASQGGSQDIFEDSYAGQKSSYFLKNGISNSDLKLIRIKNYLDAGKFNVVIDSLDENENQFEQRNHLRVQSSAYLSEAFLRTRNYDKAIKYAEQVISLNPAQDKWLAILSKINIATAKYHKGRKSEALEFLEEAESRNDFEFKDYLQSRIEWLRRRLIK